MGIKALIPCQRTNLTQKFKLLDDVSGYDLYYSLTKDFIFSFIAAFHLGSTKASYTLLGMNTIIELRIKDLIIKNNV